MEFIILQPLQTNKKDLNTSLIQRKFEITPEEESLILHEAGGPYSGFVVKKIIPLGSQQQALNLDKCDLSFKLNVFMKHATLPEMQQVFEENLFHNKFIQFYLIKKKTVKEQRVLQFWFSTDSAKDRMTCSNSFFHNLFKGDNFPKDYFMFLLKIMQIFKVLKPIRQLKIEIEKVGSPQPLGSQCKISKLQFYF